MELIAYLDPGSDDGLSGLAVFLIVFAVVALWITLSFFIAKHAEGKGQSFLGYLLVGILVSPVISGIAALIAADRPPHNGHAPEAQPVAADPDLDRLQKLTDLRDAGALSPEEFETEKAKILGS